MLEEDGLAFTKFEWSIIPKDPNDRLFGTLVSSSVKLEDCDAVLLGLPFDGATLGRLGAADGPKALRTALRTMKIHRFSGPAVRARPRTAVAMALPSDAPNSNDAALSAGASNGQPAGPAGEIRTRIVDLGDAVL